MHIIGYVPRERPPFSALNFCSGAYHFHKLPKNLFQSITILHFLADFAIPARPSFSNISLISTVHRLPQPAQPERAAPRRPGSSGDSHFHAQNRSSSFRSPAFSRAKKRLKLVPEPHIFKLVPKPRIFTLDRERRSGALAHFSLCRGTYLPKFGGEYPPPPPSGNISYRLSPKLLIHPRVCAGFIQIHCKLTWNQSS